MDLWADGWNFIRSIMSENCVITALPGFYIYIYSGQKYKNEDDTIIMIM